MKKLLIFIACLSFSCFQLDEKIAKEFFMSTCNSDGNLTEYCECIYEKLKVKYSNDWDKAEKHDWESDETKAWVEECLPVQE